MSSEDVFVFVVCGADEHINTLNFSIKALRQFSKKKILVVTDQSRNNIDIELENENIIDVKTPSAFDHHQASIYLKTGLHKFVDLKDNYCYLDSDVIALNSKVDEIFNYSYGPVTFAADHCKINSFSPYAVNCDCQERKNKDQKEFIDAIKRIIPDYEHDVVFDNEKGRELYRILSEVKENPLKNIKLIINYILVRYVFKKSNNFIKWGGGFKYSSRKKGWIDLQGNLIMYNLTSISKKLKKTSNFSFSKRKMEWVNKSGENVFFTNCNHLVEKINNKFNVDITKKNFQHWNGGVFLFNSNSVNFLETWHSSTMEIFNDNEWKTRDQGTLAATVWKFNLQNQKLLPSEFNFIADYYNPKITFQKEKGFTTNNFKTTISPNFIHVYHQFGNKEWDIWKAVEKTLQIN
jgi:hypothetical protein